MLGFAQGRDHAWRDEAERSRIHRALLELVAYFSEQHFRGGRGRRLSGGGKWWFITALQKIDAKKIKVVTQDGSKAERQRVSGGQPQWQAERDRILSRVRALGFSTGRLVHTGL